MDGEKLERTSGFWSTMHLHYFKPGAGRGAGGQTQASPVQIFKGFLILKKPKKWAQVLAGAKENLNRYRP